VEEEEEGGEGIRERRKGRRGGETWIIIRRIRREWENKIKISFCSKSANLIKKWEKKK
jgi:hypothetical protein